MAEQFLAKGPEDLAPREVLLSMSGLDYMQAILEGRLPVAPIWGIMNFRLHGVEPGRIVLRGTPGFNHANPMGAVHGGWYGTLLDTVMACAVMTTVPKGSWYTTLEYKVNITRPVPLGTEVEAEGLVQHAGRTTGVSQGIVRGVEDGRTYATGSTTCIIMKG